MKRFILATGLGLVLVGSAMAAPMKMDGPGKMEKPDLNKDGKISLEEFQKSRDRMMKLDTNKDGKISAMSAKSFKRMDKNGDGSLTPDERPKWGKRGPKHDHDGPEPK